MEIVAESGEGSRDSGADTHWVVDLCFYTVSKRTWPLGTYDSDVSGDRD